MQTEPNALLRAAGRRPRAGRARQIHARDLALRQAVSDLLRGSARADWKWCVANVQAAEKSELNGWPSFILIDPGGTFHGLALTAKGGRRANDEQEFHVWAIRHGVRYGVAGSLDEALAILDAWGAISPITVCSEGRK